ncbi:hypothetical protein Tco_0081530 [Tanacetum coccineum]
MLRQRDLGANTPLCIPYTKEEIMTMVRRASSWGTFPGLIGFWPERARPPSLSTSLEIGGGSGSGSGGGGNDESGGDEDAGRDEDM